MFFILHLIGAAVIGAGVGYLSTRLGLARQGVAVAMLLGIGGGVVAFFVFSLFGIGLFGRSGTAAIGAVLAVVFAPRLR